MRASAGVTKSKCANLNTVANSNTNPVPSSNPNLISNPTNPKLQPAFYRLPTLGGHGYSADVTTGKMRMLTPSLVLNLNPSNPKHLQHTLASCLADELCLSSDIGARRRLWTALSP